jgi:hypothetical protein
MIHRSIVVALAMVCAGCASLTGPPAASCKLGDALVETQLFFGLSKPKGGTVSAAQWEAFVKREVAPRFPEGFTVVDGAGFWLDGATKRTISEKSKVILRLHAEDAASDEAITAIIDGYKAKFEQEAVLRIDRPVCAKF